MRRMQQLYTNSMDALRDAWPVIGALMSLRAENTYVATRIPGLGECRSTFCAARRVRAAPGSRTVSFAHAVSGDGARRPA